MKNYKALIQYDGTLLRGWQVQKKDENTVQGKLQGVLEKLTGMQVEVIGSGRTDAGVHAVGQVANFHLDEMNLVSALEIKGFWRENDEPKVQYVCHALKNYMNRYLPESIAILDITEVSERFHARYSAVSKTYRYRIHVSEVPDVFERKYKYTYLDAPLDIEQMQKAAELLCGKHDFMSFCGNKHMKKSTIRTIETITIQEKKDPNGNRKEIVLDYTGDGFLQNMIRILTGTLIEIGNGRREAEEIPEILEARDRSRAGYTAPPQGLALLKVEY